MTSLTYMTICLITNTNTTQINNNFSDDEDDNVDDDETEGVQRWRNDKLTINLSTLNKSTTDQSSHNKERKTTYKNVVNFEGEYARYMPYMTEEGSGRKSVPFRLSNSPTSSGTTQVVGEDSSFANDSSLADLSLFLL